MSCSVLKLSKEAGHIRYELALAMKFAKLKLHKGFLYTDATIVNERILKFLQIIFKKTMLYPKR